MNNKKYYGEIEQSIKTLEAEIKSDNVRCEDARSRAEKARVDVANWHDNFKERSLSGKRQDLNKMQDGYDELVRQLQRDEALVEALTDKHEAQLTRLDDLRAELDSVFRELCRAWLKKEVDAYDEAARAVRQRARRMLAVYDHLRERNGSDIYRSIVGDAYVALPKAVRVVTIGDFDLSVFSGAVREKPERNFHNEVFREICGN